MPYELIQSGTFRFDRSLLVEEESGAKYGGAAASERIPLVDDSLATGVLHHRGGLYAMDLLKSLPEPGAQNFQHDEFVSGRRWWDPRPGWGKPYTIPRLPKIAIVLGDPSALDIASVINPQYLDLEERGVTVLFTASSAAAAAPFCAAFPNTGFTTVSSSASPIEAEAVVPVPLFIDPESLAGGEILVIDVNESPYSYGSAGDDSVGLVFTGTLSGDPVVEGNDLAWTGTERIKYVISTDPVPSNGYIFVRSSIAAGYISHMTTAASKLKRFGYVVIHGSDDSITSAHGTVNGDSGAAFSMVTGGSSLCSRKRFATGDWSQAAELVSETILDFFS